MSTAIRDFRPTEPIPTPYEDLLRLVMDTGTPKADRTGTGTRSLFGHQLRYDLSPVSYTHLTLPTICSV